MTTKLALLVALTLAPVALAAPVKSVLEARLKAAQVEFNRGNFEAAIRALEPALDEPGPPSVRAKLHLLRGQAHAALSDFTRAEHAFSDALAADPEASLDAEKVDPAVVSLLEEVRARTKGTLEVRVLSGGGGEVFLDGTSIGNAPFRGSVPIGRHRVSARSSDGRMEGRADVVVRADAPTITTLNPDRLVPESDAPTARVIYPFGDIRLSATPAEPRRGIEFEIGGGLRSRFLRLGLSAKLYPAFGLTLRPGLTVPVVDRVDAYLSAEAVATFSDPALFGAGGHAGIEYLAARFIGVFLELGARHTFAVSDNAFVAQTGFRLWLP